MKTLMQVFTFSIFVASGMVWVDSAVSHTGLDPDIDEITHELEEDPNNVELLIKRGKLFRTNGQLTESLDDLDRARQLESSNRELMLQRALTLAALKRDVDAEVVFDRFLEGKAAAVTESGEVTTKDVIALVERGHIRGRTGQKDLAIADFTAAIGLQPLVGLYIARGQLQESLGKLAEAALGYREGLSRRRNAISLKKGLIRVELARKRFNEALLLIDEELARASVKREWYLRRAEVLAAMGQATAAQGAREHALAEVNQSLTKRITAVHRLARAKVFIAMGRLAEAKSDLHLAIQMSPRFTEAKALLRTLGGQ